MILMSFKTDIFYPLETMSFKNNVFFEYLSETCEYFINCRLIYVVDWSSYLRLNVNQRINWVTILQCMTMSNNKTWAFAWNGG